MEKETEYKTGQSIYVRNFVKKAIIPALLVGAGLAGSVSIGAFLKSVALNGNTLMTMIESSGTILMAGIAGAAVAATAVAIKSTPATIKTCRKYAKEFNKSAIKTVAGTLAASMIVTGGTGLISAISLKSAFKGVVNHEVAPNYDLNKKTSQQQKDPLSGKVIFMSPKTSVK